MFEEQTETKSTKAQCHIGERVANVQGHLIVEFYKKIKSTEAADRNLWKKSKIKSKRGIFFRYAFDRSDVIQCVMRIHTLSYILIIAMKVMIINTIIMNLI